MNLKIKKRRIRVTAFLITLILLMTSVFPTEATGKMEELENNLSDLNQELASVSKQIKETSKRLEKAKKDLAIAKGKEEAQYESMMLRIKYMYENGNMSILETLFSSSCVAEFISNAEYITQISAYDRKKLEEYVAITEEIAKQEEQILKDQKTLASLQKDLDKKIKVASDDLTEYKNALEKAKAEAKKAEEEAKKKVEPIPPKKEESKKDPSDNTKEDSNISATASDVELLAALLECEAGTSDYEALLAVGSVVVNRMKSRYYPDTVRGVIYQSGQFPPAHNGKVDKVLKRGVKDLCVTAAKDALAGKNNVGDCLRFRSVSSGYEGLIIGSNVFF